MFFQDKNLSVLARVLMDESGKARISQMGVQRVTKGPPQDCGRNQPISTPRALASFERAMTQPSLFESTTTGLPRSRG
jgi:hypothetical protein